MRAIVQEYGKVIITAIVGVVVLATVWQLAGTSYKEAYPEHNKNHIENTAAASRVNLPVLIVEDQIKIVKGERKYDAKTYVGNKQGLEYQNAVSEYRKLAEGYENSDKLKGIPVNVFGVDEIDVYKKGAYQLLFTATNSQNKAFTKTVTVLVN